MSNTNYKDMSDKLANLTPFSGNSSGAILLTDRLTGIAEYRVFSYQTLVAMKDTAGNVWLSDKKYSVTTSRLQNLIKKAWSL